MTEFLLLMFRVSLSGVIFHSATLSQTSSTKRICQCFCENISKAVMDFIQQANNFSKAFIVKSGMLVMLSSYGRRSNTLKLGQRFLDWYRVLTHIKGHRFRFATRRITQYPWGTWISSIAFVLPHSKAKQFNFTSSHSTTSTCSSCHILCEFPLTCIHFTTITFVHVLHIFMTTAALLQFQPLLLYLT